MCNVSLPLVWERMYQIEEGITRKDLWRIGGQKNQKSTDKKTLLTE